MLNAYVSHVEKKSTNQLLKNQVKSMTEKQFRKKIFYSDVIVQATITTK